MIDYINLKEKDQTLLRKWISILKENKVEKVKNNYLIIPAGIFVELLEIEIGRKSISSEMHIEYIQLTNQYLQKYQYTYITY